MKLTVKRNDLQKALQRVSNIISSRSTLPVLSNVLLETDGDKLKLTTTDLEIRISTIIEATIIEAGKTTIPAKRILSLVNKFIADEVEITTDDKHHSSIICGTASIKLLGLSSDDFPLASSFDSVKSIVFEQNEFSKILDQISYAVSLDDSRKVLHGILFSLKDNTFTAVATDGKRLALVEKLPDNFSGDGR